MMEQSSAPVWIAPEAAARVAQRDGGLFSSGARLSGEETACVPKFCDEGANMNVSRETPPRDGSAPVRSERPGASMASILIRQQPNAPRHGVDRIAAHGRASLQATGGQPTGRAALQWPYENSDDLAIDSPNRFAAR